VEINRAQYLLRRLFFSSQVELRDGIRVNVDKRLPKGIKKALYKETYESDERYLVNKMLEPEDRVLEIGAGIGVVSSLCGLKCSKGAVVSYEANPNAYDFALENIKLNKLSIDLRNKMLGSERGEKDFYISSKILSSSAKDRGFGGKVTLPCDDISEVIGDFKPTALVMDVEGAEVDLVPLVKFASIKKIIIELHPWIVGGNQIDDVKNLIESNGFVKINSKTAPHVLGYIKD
jgi:FkbM family methyltransferase